MKQALLIAAVLVMVPAHVGTDRWQGRAAGTWSAPGDEWPGWRGQGAEGRTSQPLPTRWAVDRGIRWKAPVPGHGHSSPIAFGDRVYVTTAYQTVSGQLLNNALRAATFVLNLVIATLALQVVSVRCRRPTDPWRKYGLSTAIVAAVLALMLIDSFGEAMLDLSRSPVRQWIGSTLFVSICCALVALVAETRRLRLMTGIVSVAFSGIALSVVPAPDYAFRGGPESLRMQIAVAAAASPLVAGLIALLSVPPHRPASAMRCVIMAAVATAVVAGSVGLLHHVLVFRDEGFPETSYIPRLAVSSLVLPVAAVSLLWLARRRPSSLPLNLSGVGLGGLSLVVAAAAALEWVATRSPYLAYQLGTGQLDALPAGLQVAGLAVTVAGVVHLERSGETVLRLPSNHVPTALATVALLLAVVFFARANYVNPITTLTRAIVSLDRASGRIMWTLEGLDGPAESIDGRNSPATPTPVTDGRLVCAYFGTPGLMCANRDGRLAWARTDLTYTGLYGAAFSPLLANGVVVLARDTPAGTAFVDAFDARTGATRWSRTFPTTPTFSGNSRTPLMRELNGQQTIVLWGMNYVKALALRDGELIWSYGHSSGGDVVSSAISDPERLYLSDAGGTVALDLAALGGGHNPVRWKSDVRSNCASPVLVNGILFTITDSGIAAAIRVATGERLWRQRLPGQYFASLIASPETVYFTNSAGVTTVVAADGTFRVVAENRLDEETTASMAAAGGELFVRSAHHLYAIGND